MTPPGLQGRVHNSDPVLAPFDNVSEAVSGSIAVPTLAGLASGNHTIYVHGQDAAGNWGSHNTIVLNLDKTGPATTGIVQTPAVTNGTVAVNISATSIDSASGGSNVTAGEYRIDGGAIQSMNPVASPAPIVSLTATINAATMSGLAVGSHTLEIPRCRCPGEPRRLGGCTIDRRQDRSGDQRHRYNAGCDQWDQLGAGGRAGYGFSHKCNQC